MTLKLDLTKAPRILYLFGPVGAGKSYVSDLIGTHAGWHVYHADKGSTPEMREAVQNQISFSRQMKERYYEIVCDKVLKLSESHTNLVVDQATYKAVDREYIQSRIPNMDLICVMASDQLITERLQVRGGSVPPDYASRVRASFEEPGSDVKRIINDSDDGSIISQLNVMYSNTVQ